MSSKKFKKNRGKISFIIRSIIIFEVKVLLSRQLFEICCAIFRLRLIEPWTSKLNGKKFKKSKKCVQSPIKRRRRIVQQVSRDCKEEISKTMASLKFHFSFNVSRGIWIFTIFENGNIPALPLVARCKNVFEKKLTGRGRQKWRLYTWKRGQLDCYATFFPPRNYNSLKTWTYNFFHPSARILSPSLARLYYNKLFLRHSALLTSLKRKLPARPFGLIPVPRVLVAVHARNIRIHVPRRNNFDLEGQFEHTHTQNTRKETFFPLTFAIRVNRLSREPLVPRFCPTVQLL